MARYPNTLFGPAGACDVCGRFCCVLSQAGAPDVPGIRCYHCHHGTFRHRADWNFWKCPCCHGARCVDCNYSGLAAVPRER